MSTPVLGGGIENQYQIMAMEEDFRGIELEHALANGANGMYMQKDKLRKVDVQSSDDQATYEKSVERYHRYKMADVVRRNALDPEIHKWSMQTAKSHPKLTTTEILAKRDAFVAFKNTRTVFREIVNEDEQSLDYGLSEYGEDSKRAEDGKGGNHDDYRLLKKHLAKHPSMYSAKVQKYAKAES